MLFGWAVFWLLVVIIGTCWNALGHWGQVPWIKPWSNDFWLGFWHVTTIGLSILVTVVTSIWFTFGSIHARRVLFQSLKAYHIDNADNGRVKEHKQW